MEKQQSLILHSQCCCCMTKNDEIRLQTHVINSEALRHIFQTDQLILCYICKKVAEHADQFVQNVQKNQSFFARVKIEKGLETRLESVQPIYNLTQLTLNVLELKIEIRNEELLIKKEELESTDLDTDINDSGNINLTSFIEQNDEANNESYKSEPIELHEIMAPLETVKKEELESTDLDTDINDSGNINLTSFIEQNDEANNESYKSEPIELHEIMAPLETGGGSKIIFELLTHGNDNESDVTHRESPDKETLDDGVKETLNEAVRELGNEVDDDFSYPEEETSKEVEGSVEVPKPGIFYITIEECKKEHDTQALSSSYAKAPFKCKHCKSGFQMKASLDKHLKIHKDEGEFERDICNLHFPTPAKLQTHISNHKRKHPEEVGDTPISPKKKKKHVCDECGRETKTAQSLKNHKKLHEIERKEFLCVECNRSFKTKTGLHSHLNYTKLHSYVLICDYCNQEFSSKRRLITHIKCHIGLFKEVKCKICNKGFRDETEMKKHVRRNHHGYRPPRDKFCPICNKGFREQKYLKIHLRVHTGEKPISCSKCPAKFAQTGALYYHNKLVHLGLRKDGTAKTKTRKKRE